MGTTRRFCGPPFELSAPTVRWCCCILVTLFFNITFLATGNAKEDIDNSWKKLTDKNKEVREATALKFKVKGLAPPEALPALLQAVNDENPVVRHYAVWALGEIISTAGRAVASKLKDPNAEVRKMAMEAILKISKPIGEGIISARDPISANESKAIGSCKSYAQAQDIYRRKDWDRDEVLEYAQSISGTNSLYETKRGAGDVRYVNQDFAEAARPSGRGKPKQGYFFRILIAQGENAPGGKKTYLKGGNLILGYALIAYPADYGKTGRHTFIINNNGTVYQKNLGAKTQTLVQKINEYNPDHSWVVAE